MNLLVKISGIVACLLITGSALFRILHWGGGSMLGIAGLAIFFAIYLPAKGLQSRQAKQTN